MENNKNKESKLSQIKKNNASELKSKSDNLEKNQSSEGAYNSSSMKSNKMNPFTCNISFGVNFEDIQSKDISNEVSSTKYNLFSFLPKSILFQFKRLSNFYFLIISIFTLLSFTPKEPASMIGTLAFVIVVSLIKEFYEDYSRYLQDEKSNSQTIFKIDSNGWKSIKCKDLRPGNIVRVFKEEEFSADILLVKTSTLNGLCHVDTKNLDGESYPKEKYALDLENINLNSDYKKFNGVINCQEPNEFINDFSGNLKLYNSSGLNNSENEFSINTQLTIKNLLLKGCVLKNTEYIIGIVVYIFLNVYVFSNHNAIEREYERLTKKKE
jgi:phospholipid-transporting ATPase